MNLDLTITVTIAGKDVEVGELLKIDEMALSAEYAAQAARYAYIAVLAAQAKRNWAEAERARKEEEAAAFKEYKEQVKVTDGFAKQLVQSDEKVNSLRKAEIEEEYNYRLMEALTKAFEIRSSMLISLGADQRQEWSQTDMHLNQSVGERAKAALIARHERE